MAKEIYGIKLSEQTGWINGWNVQALIRASGIAHHVKLLTLT